MGRGQREGRRGPRRGQRRRPRHPPGASGAALRGRRAGSRVAFPLAAAGARPGPACPGHDADVAPAVLEDGVADARAVLWWDMEQVAGHVARDESDHVSALVDDHRTDVGEARGHLASGAAEEAGAHGRGVAGCGAGEHAHPGQQGGPVGRGGHLDVTHFRRVHLEQGRVAPALRQDEERVGDHEEREQGAGTDVAQGRSRLGWAQVSVPYGGMFRAETASLTRFTASVTSLVRRPTGVVARARRPRALGSRRLAEGGRG